MGVLGEGTFGQVKEAKCLNTGKIVAIKLIKNAFENEYESHKLARELEIQKQLSSRKSNIFAPKIIEVIFPENDASHLFIVMTYVQNDLKNLLNSMVEVKVRLSEEHVLTIIYNLLCALNYLHGSNIMHRDLKPGNILINKDCEIKICDFGLSRSVPDGLSTEDNIWSVCEKQRISVME